MPPEFGLFTSLHKWARQQDENFCTEGLIFLLRLMLRESPPHAASVIGWLTDGLIGPECLTGTVTITGQVAGDEGRPDIEFRVTGKTAWIEVKVDSAVGPTQLERYRRMLSRKSGETKLILLSRGADESATPNHPDCARSWIGLSDRLECVLSQLEPRLSHVSFILRDFLSFLGPKQMRLNSVSRSASHSIADVATMLSQLKLACSLENLRWKLNASDSKSYLGYKLFKDRECVGWIGFNFTDPQWLFYTTEEADFEESIDADLAQQSNGNGKEWNGIHWMNSLDLMNCEAYLTAGADAQVEYLRTHLIDESLRAVRAMTKSIDL